MNQYRYEVVGDLYWDGTKLLKKGEVFTVTAEEPLKIAAPVTGGLGGGKYQPSLKLLKDEEDEHPVHRGRKPKADDI